MKYDNKKRFTIFEKYRFDKYILRICFLFLALIILGVFMNQNFNYANNNFYYTCKDMPCANPFYCDSNNIICKSSLEKYIIPEGFPVEERQFPPGFEWGKRPPWIVENFDVIIFFILLFGFLINHFVHNKQFDFKAFNKRIHEEK